MPGVALAADRSVRRPSNGGAGEPGQVPAVELGEEQREDSLAALGSTGRLACGTGSPLWYVRSGRGRTTG
ncbi:hypothetical protein GCM10010236_81490 [Streptomyces eurythermus]|nr:hypothetical protein GCM10010236_81490 [Streptomyces eurythermus]